MYTYIFHDCSAQFEQTQAASLEITLPVSAGSTKVYVTGAKKNATWPKYAMENEQKRKEATHL